MSDLVSVVPSGSVIFIDTLNRTAPTADENSSKDMGEILEGAKNLQNQIDGLVVLIHHTGKDPGKGARGHSSFFAALDGAIEVERTNAGRAWSVAKAKDGEDGKRFPFKLKVHILGVDSDGDEFSSCTVERDKNQIFKVSEPKGAAQKAALRTLKTAINASATAGKAGASLQTQCMKVDDAVAKVAATLTTVEANKRNNRARKLLTDLTGGGHLLSALDGDEAWVWLPS